MTIDLVRGDILKTQAEAVVNTVNCVGFMGRGIALQFKRAFPANFRAYDGACKRGEVEPGKMFVFRTGQLAGPRYIINFPTKRHWRGKSRVEDIESGLAALIRTIQEHQIHSIAVPPLGCGLGGLAWADVRPRIERAFAAVPDVKALIFEPSSSPNPVNATRSTDAPKMTPGRAVLINLMERYLAGLMDPFVSLLEVHKLMYFTQEAGERLRLRYVKGYYGPYAENLRQVLAAIEGHFVTGYGDGGDSPNKPLALVPGALKDAERFLKGHPETQARFDRVAKLVEGFETPFGMELLATVHWVGAHDRASNAEAAARAVHSWNDRKQRFSSQQIALAWDVLASNGWLRHSAMAPVKVNEVRVSQQPSRRD